MLSLFRSCRACPPCRLHAAAAAVAASPSPSPSGCLSDSRRLSPLSSPLLSPAAPPLVACRRGFLSSVRSWLTEGPEAAAPVDAPLSPTPTPPPPPPPPSDAPLSSSSSDSSFFVNDSAELLESLQGSAQLLNQLGEPTFASLGLGTGLWPTSMPLRLLEFMHVSGDLPWWVCMAAIGVGVRLVMVYPTMLWFRLGRVDLPKMRRMQELRSQINLADMTKNYTLIQRLATQMMEEFPEMANPRKMRRDLLIRQGGAYVSYGLSIVLVQLASIRAIYRAAALPVESFQSGGLLWLQDLTCIDPYFTLPAVVTGLLLLNLRLYFRNIGESNQIMLAARPLVYTMAPMLMFTLMINFPSASLFYFVATGCTAQLLHQLNATDAVKNFWHRTIGLPPVDAKPTVDPVAAAATTERLKRIDEETKNRVQTRGYEAARNPDPNASSSPPKTFRIRRTAGKGKRPPSVY